MLSPGDPRLQVKLKLMSFNRKYLLVSIAFIGLRIWNIIADVVFGFVRPNHHHHYEALVYLDAIGDTGQGFVNFVLFCVLQPKIRRYVKDGIRRHWRRCRYRCWECCNNDEVIDDESFAARVTPSQMSNCSSDPQRDLIED